MLDLTNISFSSKIRGLDLSYFEHSERAKEAALALTDLHNLRLAGVTLHPNDIKSIVEKNPLRALNLSHSSINTKALLPLTESAKDLTHLDLSNCDKVTDFDVLLIAQNLPQLEHC